MNLLWLNDGKAVHRRQAEGLLAGLARCGVTLQVHERVVPLGLRDWPRMQAELLNTLDPESNKPDLLLGVGHRTHALLLLLKRRYPRAQTVVLMRPSLPFSWFDHLIIPQHDQPPSVDRIFVSQGALNPLINQQRHQVGRHLILLGGASKRHGWDQAQVLAQLAQLAEYLRGQSIWISGSRRTPADFLSSTDFQSVTASMQFLEDSQTDSTVLDEQLQFAETVWVTEDSVSMISEAWTAGCRVGLIAMPRIKTDRITGAVDLLVQQQVVWRLNDVLAGQVLRLPPQLTEADRAACWLLLQLSGRLR
ncbi:MAG: ELM1/GtrOC1 family putative glycosyltransferase [Moraxellaceae bacterium]